MIQNCGYKQKAYLKPKKKIWKIWLEREPKERFMVSKISRIYGAVLGVKMNSKTPGADNRV